MIKMEEQPLTPQRETTKKERQGRWSKAQKYLFQSLLQKFGKNWTKIHEKMPQRSLSQLRSHAQKFFEKVGPAKVQEYKRTADLIEAYQILDRENIRQLESTSPVVNHAQLVKQEQETSNGEEEKPSESESDKSSASEKLIKVEDKKVLNIENQTMGRVESINFLSMLGLVNSSNPMEFMLQLGTNSLFMPYGLNNVLLNSLQANANELQ